MLNVIAVAVSCMKKAKSCTTTDIYSVAKGAPPNSSNG
jgi:hypothetical protein